MGYSYDRATEGAHFRKFYARLIKAMSMEHALETLGFKPDDHPSEQEISKAFKEKALENHPDRGGDHQKMVDVNVAKDVLLGRQSPDRDQSTNAPTNAPRQPWTREEGGGWNPAYADPRSPPKREEVTFEQAEAKAGIPSGVEWLFVTDTQRSAGNYSSDEFSNFKRAWCAVGQTDSSWVFVAAGNSQYDAYVVGGGGGHDIWEIKAHTYPKSTPASPAFLFNGVVKALNSLNVKVKFNSKVRDAKGATFSKRMPDRPGTAVSIKHMMVNMGLVSDEDESVANRKHVVEIQVVRDHMYGSDQPKPGFFQENSKYLIYDGKNHGGWFKVTLTLNGKEYNLSEKDWQTFEKLRVGGHSVRDLCEGKYEKKKNITRMPKGKIILQGLVEHLKDLPDAAVAVLAKAAAQMKG